jgi:hypothetical protein
MGSAAAGAEVIGVHAVLNFSLEGEGGFPVDLGFLAEDDSAYQRVGAVWGLNAAGSQVGFTFEFLVAARVVELPATSELCDQLFIVWDDYGPAFDELADR